jgi:hypothetical protein
MKRITITKNWFFSAGGKYKWEKNYDRRGVGIRLDTLKENAEIELVIAGVLYHLNCNQAITFIKTFKSVENHKGINIGIVSKSVLNEVILPKKEPEKEFSTVSTPEVLQPKLL